MTVNYYKPHTAETHTIMQLSQDTTGTHITTLTRVLCSVLNTLRLLKRSIFRFPSTLYIQKEGLLPLDKGEHEGKQANSFLLLSIVETRRPITTIITRAKHHFTSIQNTCTHTSIRHTEKKLGT